MVTLNQYNGKTVGTAELYGLSTDEKPTTYKNGDMFYEMDTKKCYVFDEENKKWWEV
jgi:hypothetical protein